MEISRSDSANCAVHQTRDAEVDPMSEDRKDIASTDSIITGLHVSCSRIGIERSVAGAA